MTRPALLLPSTPAPPAVAAPVDPTALHLPGAVQVLQSLVPASGRMLSAALVSWTREPDERDNQVDSRQPVRPALSKRDLQGIDTVARLATARVSAGLKPHR